MDFDDDLWGPPRYVEDDTFANQTLPGCEFWFDPRTDVIEENFLNEKYCEQAWQIMNNKQKPDAELNQKKDSDSASASTASDLITTMTPSFEPRSKRQKMDETKESFNGTGLKICQETTAEEGENEIVSLILLNNKQKPDAEIQKDSDSSSASVQNDMATSENLETHAIVSSHSVRSVAEVEVTCVGVKNDHPNEDVASPLGQITCFDLNFP